jgi:hypothetical protein
MKKKTKKTIVCIYTRKYPVYLSIHVYVMEVEATSRDFRYNESESGVMDIRKQKWTLRTKWY